MLDKPVMPKGLTKEEREAREKGLGEALQNRFGERIYGYFTRIPGRYRSVVGKAIMGRCSAKTAIKAKCLDCVGFEDVDENIGNCKAYSCPIWTFRPYQPKKGEVWKG